MKVYTRKQFTLAAITFGHTPQIARTKLAKRQLEKRIRYQTDITSNEVDRR